ncbi:protein phosphatase 2C domain-containing protein [Demequina sp. TTPB684]|uniref:PP2C family protein-serine/threonine phosphatase n=1 Tax=unclassified Demequina TaxID=2620311 RepID=UPI001CF24F2A|nr:MULTISPECIES: protein phosphatase 2C domain-containing protein [unclassified Demequina]MCB2413188.1 protein phosphatase 2C domain-containing protein [Demequina sp. TTPB684]UPU88363.1 protein phosphatase 2C domain-containing protein [Demequina sp. TMPB413]
MGATHHAGPVTLSAGAASDVGTTRAHNEDSYLCEAPLFLVADGMGGYAAGEVASAMVVDEFRPLAGAETVAVEQMREAFDRASARVDALAGETEGAGTTLTGVGLASVGGVGYWVVVNVGDSRTYRYDGARLEQISVDHSVVQELIEAGELTAQQARGDSRRNMVTRAIGAGAPGEPDFWMVPVETGDRVVVCSDGLSGELEDEVIEATLARVAGAQEAADDLVRQALEAGARDNVTVIVVNAEHVGSSDEHAPGADTVPRADAPAEGAS